MPVKNKLFRTSKKKDSARKAKPLGYRYKNIDKSDPDYFKRPTANEIALFEAGDWKMKNIIDYEDRPERADSNQKNKLNEGGDLENENDENDDENIELNIPLKQEAPVIVPVPVITPTPVIMHEQGGLLEHERAQLVGIEIPTHELEIIIGRPIKWYQPEVSGRGCVFVKCFLRQYWKMI